MQLTALKYTDKKTKLDLFRDAARIQKAIGKDAHGQRVEDVLDGIEKQVKKGLVIYDMKTRVILHDRTSILASLYRNYAIGVPQVA